MDTGEQGGQRREEGGEEETWREGRRERKAGVKLRWVLALRRASANGRGRADAVVHFSDVVWNFFFPRSLQSH